MISTTRFVEGVESIYTEQPDYELGHDGSDGKCDCIGMVRGASLRAGEKNVKNMGGTNQAARKAIQNLSPLKKEGQLKNGDVVLKTRDKDDASFPLPERYRKGNEDYDPDVGEMNFTHIGTVTKTDPLVITHMTSPKAKKDSSIKGWGYFGQLPWVSDTEEDPTIEKAIVYADSGSTVKMRNKPSTLCRLYWDVPVGSEVVVVNPGDKWSEIIWAGRTGYMMSKFLLTGCTYAVVIPGLTRAEADVVSALYPNSYIEAEKG